jgi:hypothetical protein
MAEFMASLIELSHKYIASRKRAAPKRGELRVFTQPLRMSVTRPSKMLRYARMAALRKLRRGIGHTGQRRLWAGSCRPQFPR